MKTLKNFYGILGCLFIGLADIGLFTNEPVGAILTCIAVGCVFAVCFLILDTKKSY